MKGRIEFECSDKYLTDGFAWAKDQALVYSHEDDPVGYWYESALPGRDAFCMRDASHQSRGAHVLGLEKHNKNMFMRFAQSISESRDFCCFWEIDKYYRPSPADYQSDESFWYNLPANFDVLDACWRMYKLSGDRDYIDSLDFRHFYDLSMNEYIKKWDFNGDGVVDSDPNAKNKRRGIGSYEEWAGQDSAQMTDLPAAQQKAMLDYAEIKKLQGDAEGAKKYAADAQKIIDNLDSEWWDESEKDFYMFKGHDGKFGHIEAERRPFEYVMYFDAVKDPRKQQIFLDALDKRGRTGTFVEALSYFSEIFYNYGQPERGLHWLRAMVNPELKRRDYPEISYAAVGDYIFGLMGVKYDLEKKTVTADPKLPADMKYAKVKNLPVYGKEADITVENGSVSIDFH